MFPVNVSPSMAMYNLLKSQGYDPAYALAEFIDNALQAHISNIETDKNLAPLKVSLYFHSHDFYDNSLKNSIIIEDNGSGITKQRLIDAMRPAKPPEKKGLSEFGIGMKAAAVWFADEWKLITKPSEETFRYALEFNLNALFATQTDVIDVVESEDSGVCGTKICLKNLSRPVNKLTFHTICTDLKELYQKFTSGESTRLILNAYFDNELFPLVFEKKHEILNKPIYKTSKGVLYAIGKPIEWKVDVSLLFQGVNITGFICIRNVGSYDNPGLVIFRYGRVIEGLSSKKCMPKAIYKTQNKHEAQRVYGELTGNDLPVTYTKDKFEINLEDLALELIKQPGVEELLNQASRYRTKKAIPVDSESDIGKVKAPLEPEVPLIPETPETPEPEVPLVPETPEPEVPLVPETPITPPLVPLDNATGKSPLISPKMLQSEFQTNQYCQDLIKQINWVFENKKNFKEIVIVALRNLLENHLDFTYGEAFPQGQETKFENKLEEMLNLARSTVNVDLTKFVTTINSLLNHSSHGFQTQKNLYNVHFSEDSIKELISALHLSAHKGNNIVSLDKFVSTYGIQYNMLLEFLHCFASYNKTINSQTTTS